MSPWLGRRGSTVPASSIEPPPGLTAHHRRPPRGDLFPLSHFPIEQVVNKVSRGTQQRILRRAQRVRMKNEVVDSLNWMMGCSAPPDAPEASNDQRRVHERISRLVDERGPPLGECITEEASRALLGSVPGYDLDADSTLASFKKGNVSLPESVADAPMATALLPESHRDLLEDFEQHMLLSDKEFEEVDDHGRPIELYMDPVLDKDSKEYLNFVLDLHRRGMLHFTRNPKEFVKLFFC